MILIPIVILLLIVVVRLQKGMFHALLFIIATKSLMDTFWDIGIGPLSALAIQGATFPIIFYKLFTKFKELPNYWKNSAKIYLVALSLGLFWSIALNPLIGLQDLVLNVNIFLAFLILPHLITSKKRFNQLLFAMMIAGLFPISVSIFQFQTGIVFQERQTIGLTRYVGFYHDAFPVRFYGLMTLLAVFIYGYTNKIKKWFTKLFLIMVTVGALFSIYLVFSKAAVAILGLWVISILLMSKSKVKHLVSTVFGIAILILIFGDTFSSNIEQLFSKEVGYQSGAVKDARYTLAGRGYIWQDFWQFWSTEQTMFFQWFGDGITRPTHNEFLRVLMASGIMGLLLLVFYVFRITKHIFRINKNIRVFGFMLVGMYLVDSIGLVPGVYYYYNILLWGIFGLLLLRPYLFYKTN